MTPVVVLIGEGVQKRAGELARVLSPRWGVQRYPGDGSVQEEMRTAVAAVGMPGALCWDAVMPSLRFLQLPGAGLDGLDPSHLPDGCEVCNVHEHEGAVAEYVFACLMRMSDDWLTVASNALKEGQWLFFDRIGGACRPSRCGTVLGIVGFGHIGQRCARLALMLNMEVVVCTRTMPFHGRSENPWGSVRFLASPGEVAAACDVFLIACPLTRDTRGLIGREILGRLRSHAVLINPARAEIVDEQALFEALSSRRIRGAILDVWSREPRTVSERFTGSPLPFHHLDNVIATPHLAAHTEDMVRRRWRFIAENLNRWLAGEPRLNRVEPTTHRLLQSIGESR